MSVGYFGRSGAVVEFGGLARVFSWLGIDFWGWLDFVILCGLV